MGLNGVSNLSAIRMEANFAKQEGAREAMEDALDNHESEVEAGFENRLEKIEKEHAAAETKRMGALFGSIFGGFLIGTAIGEAIGGWANNGDEEAARELGMEIERNDIRTERAFEEFESAREALEEAGEQVDATTNIQQKINRTGYTGI